MAEERILVRDVMSRDIIAVEPEDTVAQAISKMEQHQIHELPVMHGASLKGWVNYDALIQRAHLPPIAKVTTVMVAGPRLSQSSDLVEAAALMIGQNVRAAPVLDSRGKLVGILSRTDVMRAAGNTPSIADLPLDRVMNRDLETIHESAAIDEAAKRLRELSIRQLIVLDDKGKLVGTVGREAILHALTAEDRAPARGGGRGSSSGGPGRQKARAVSIKGLADQPILLRPSDTLGLAIKQMLRNHRTMVVVEATDGLPVGVVSRANVLERLAARAVTTGPIVQVVGLNNHIESSGMDQIHSYAQKTLEKVGRQFRVEFLSLHYKVYKAKVEGDSKYSVTAHLSTEQKFLVAKADEWDPIVATDAVLEELERRAIEAKELRLERRKATPRRKARLYDAS